MRCERCGALNAEQAGWCTQCYAVLSDDGPQDGSAGAVPATGPGAPSGGAAPPGSAAGGPEDPEGPVVRVQGLAARPLRADPADLPPRLRGLVGPDTGPGGDAGGRGPAAPHPGPSGSGEEPPPLPGTDEAAAVPDAHEPEPLGDGRFRRSSEGLEWSCGLCREWNPLERTTCRVCGTGFGQQPGDAPAATPDVEPAVLAGASVLLPGAGHLLLGRTAEGLTRLLLALVWGAGGLALLRGALASGRPVLPALPLLLGWVALAVGCTNDALVLGGVRGRVLLEPRVLLWLVVAVVGGTAAGALVGVLQVTGG